MGGSLAGLRSAEALRREGFDGRIVIVSGEERLPYDRPPLSKQVLAGSWEPEAAALAGASEVDANWLLGVRATALDVGALTVTLDDGTARRGDGVIIATGAAPRRLAGPSFDGVFTLRTLGDCLALRDALRTAQRASERLAVVGAGFIGSEVAATARGLGLDVTVIEAFPVPLLRALGPVMGEVCGRLHAANGVALQVGVGVERLEGSNGRVERVRLSDGRAVEAGVVVVGVGVVPETGWLDGSGLKLDNGVVCDAWCRAAPGVVAAGDVARWHNRLFAADMRVEHWSNAVEQAEAAARSLLHGEAAAPYAPVPYFWSDQYGTKIQFLGHASGDDEVMVVEGAPEEGRFVAAYGRRGRLVGALLFNRPARLPAFKRLIAQRAAFPPDTN